MYGIQGGPDLEQVAAGAAQRAGRGEERPLQAKVFAGSAGGASGAGGARVGGGGGRDEGQGMVPRELFEEGSWLSDVTAAAGGGVEAGAERGWGTGVSRVTAGEAVVQARRLPRAMAASVGAEEGVGAEDSFPDQPRTGVADLLKDYVDMANGVGVVDGGSGAPPAFTSSARRRPNVAGPVAPPNEPSDDSLRQVRVCVCVCVCVHVCVCECVCARRMKSQATRSAAAGNAD